MMKGLIAISYHMIKSTMPKWEVFQLWKWDNCLILKYVNFPFWGGREWEMKPVLTYPSLKLKQDNWFSKKPMHIKINPASCITNYDDDKHLLLGTLFLVAP